jgi:hypothetical protein
MLPYWQFADRFHWPPSVVDHESRLRMWAIGMIDGVAQEIRARNRQNEMTAIGR